MVGGVSSGKAVCERVGSGVVRSAWTKKAPLAAIQMVARREARSGDLRRLPMCKFEGLVCIADGFGFEVGRNGYQGRNKDTMVRNFVGLSPGFCALPASSSGSHSFGSNASFVVLKETWPSPQRVLIPVGFLAVVWGLVRTV